MQRSFSLAAIVALALMALVLHVVLETPAAFAQEKKGPNGNDDIQKELLTFKFEALRMISPRSGPNKGRVYWYMLYTLENKTGEDRDYYLSIGGRSNRKKTYTDTFLPSVEKAIERKVGRPLWGQHDIFKILRERDPEDEKYNYVTIKADKKLQCVAVFNRLDPNANTIDIEVVGLSNDLETSRDEDGSTLITERVRTLHFKRPGDEYGIDQDPFRLVGKEWTKKTTKVEAAR
ncbi:MAG: hypothetical protein O7J95_02395 [Planctomycetota bacterium]|nr:hypothetical protein [Planctomycetota bacterium]